jgi:biotin-dependent carboxylase-like uncharacterized protein
MVTAMSDVVVSVTGADCELTVGGNKADLYSPLLLKEGDEMAIGKSAGLLNYVALAGSLAAETAMGSSSTYVRGGFGGYGGRALKAGDVLGVTELSDSVLMREVRPSDRTKVPDGSPLRAVWSSLNDDSRLRKAFYESEFTVSEAADRVGYRLKLTSESLKAGGRQLLTYPAYPGYVQIPPDGSPIVLQQDCPTTGGYLMAAMVVASDMGRFSQLKPGSRIRFEDVDTGFAGRDSSSFRRTLQKYAVESPGL